VPSINRVDPSIAIADSPTRKNVHPTTVDWLTAFENMSAFPLTWSNVTPATVIFVDACTKTAAPRWIAQSPPLGHSYGLKYL
jgi:hypothetical protein